MASSASSSPSPNRRCKAKRKVPSSLSPSSAANAYCSTMRSVPSARKNPPRSSPPSITGPKPMLLPVNVVSLKTIRSPPSTGTDRRRAVVISTSALNNTGPPAPSAGESSDSRTISLLSRRPSCPVVSTPLRGLPAKLSRLPAPLWALTKVRPKVAWVPQSASRRPATKLVKLSCAAVGISGSISTMGRLGRANKPVKRKCRPAKLVTTPLKPTLRKVIGVRVAKISSPIISE